MGHTCHHAIVLTSTDRGVLLEAYEKACELFGHPFVTSVTAEAINHTQSFMIPPDGSNEGWRESEAGDVRRETFRQYLRSLAYEDGSTPIDWVEVQFGDDYLDTRVTDDSDHDRRALIYAPKVPCPEP